MCKITKNIPSAQAKHEFFNFECSKKTVECSFTAPDLSSNGGLLLMKAMAAAKRIAYTLPLTLI